MDSLNYSGVWISEGHSISFYSLDEDTMEITENYRTNGEEVNTTQKVNLQQAIDYQERYIKLGYDKIS